MDQNQNFPQPGRIPTPQQNFYPHPSQHQRVPAKDPPFPTQRVSPPPDYQRQQQGVSEPQYLDQRRYDPEQYQREQRQAEQRETLQRREQQQQYEQRKTEQRQAEQHEAFEHREQQQQQQQKENSSYPYEQRQQEPRGQDRQDDRKMYEQQVYEKNQTQQNQHEQRDQPQFQNPFRDASPPRHSTSEQNTFHQEPIKAEAFQTDVPQNPFNQKAYVQDIAQQEEFEREKQYLEEQQRSLQQRKQAFHQHQQSLNGQQQPSFHQQQPSFTQQVTINQQSSYTQPQQPVQQPSQPKQGTTITIRGPESDELDYWRNRINQAAADPTSVTAQQGDAPWSAEFFDCFNPIDKCLITWCCPCVTFSKIHHRLHKDKNLQGWSFINNTCIAYYVGSWFGLQCVGNFLQRTEIRDRSNPKLKGDFVGDCTKAWCCACCDLIQQDKESEALVARESGGITAQPRLKQEEMNYNHPGW